MSLSGNVGKFCDNFLQKGTKVKWKTKVGEPLCRITKISNLINSNQI